MSDKPDFSLPSRDYAEVYAEWLAKNPNCKYCGKALPESYQVIHVCDKMRASFMASLEAWREADKKIEWDPLARYEEVAAVESALWKDEYAPTVVWSTEDPRDARGLDYKHFTIIVTDGKHVSMAWVDVDEGWHVSLNNMLKGTTFIGLKDAWPEGLMWTDPPAVP